MIYSTARVLSTDAEKPKIRQSVGLDARVAAPSRTQKPKLLFIVVGETGREQAIGVLTAMSGKPHRTQALNALNF